MKPAMSPQQARYSSSEGSALALYRDHAVGDVSWLSFLYYECTQVLLSNLPGAAGFALRAAAYPRLFAACAGRPAFGRSVVIRNPAKIALGRKCMIDDFAVLDARGAGARIQIGDYVSLGRGSALVAKDSTITLGHGVNISSSCRIATQSTIEIGDSTLIAAYAYIGPGNHQSGTEEHARIEGGMENKGGVRIGKNVWIGARATILDGVTIGDGAVIGAHALVRHDVPAEATAVGIPARIVKGAG